MPGERAMQAEALAQHPPELRAVTRVDVLPGAVRGADERAVVRRQAPPLRVALAELDLGLGDVCGIGPAQPVRQDGPGGEPPESKAGRAVVSVAW